MANPASAFKQKNAPKKVAKKAAKKAVKKTAPKTPAKKAAVKRSIEADKDNRIKYADKSGGQPNLVPIFETIKAMFVPYIKGDMKLHGGVPGKALLINHRAVEIDGRKKPEMWFVSALIQKGYVGFYYMPVYMNTPVRNKIKPELLKCLKGKACFHIKKHDPVIYAQIKEALKIGFDDYRNKGWV